MSAARATIASLLQSAAGRIGGDSGRLDAELLLCSVLSRPRAWLYAHGTDPAPATPVLVRFEALVQQRVAGRPVAHLLGMRGFWSLDLAVDASTLIPRPETELLVEAALQRLAPGSRQRVADLGTGTGAIALALAHERPGLSVVATDASAEALALARRNRDALGLGRVELRQGSWYQPLRGERFAVIVSNPPYIAGDDPCLALGDVRFEPRSALVAGADGLDDLRVLAAGAPDHLEPGGWLLLEHGHDQADAVRDLLDQAGLRQTGSRQDLQGHARISFGCRRPD